MYVSGFDHIAIPGRHIEEALRFYRSLGFAAPAPEEWRENPTRIVAIRFGNNKINIHTPDAWEDADFTLRGHKALPGCGDICFVWDGSINELLETLKRANAPIEAGPVELTGARRNGTARGVSVYTRDPDQNLLEFIVYESA
jgi:catechol 2,3-dioxygenase-like lactoylglutathione lyase family enzyme